MEAIELIELISRGEDSRTQFKQSQDVTNAKSLAGEMVAFANSKGGRILIGVDDTGSVIGLSPGDIRRINQLISSTATDCVRPSINPETENISVGGLLVMVVTVPEGISKPYADNDGVFWVKSGANKRRVTSREEVQRMLQSADLVHADEVPVGGTTSGDMDLKHFRTFFKKQYKKSLDRALEKTDIPLGRLLNNLGLARGETLNLAGLMLFGSNPQIHRPAFVIKAVSFVGNDPAGDKYRDSQDIEGCLRDLYKGTISFLTRNLRRLQDEKGFNTEGNLEVPLPALEELVVNMLLHRDYFISAPCRVLLFDNRIELISPGALPNNLTVENIRNGVSVIRNPLIASFATKGNELPYRGIGTGILRALSAVPALELESDHERNLFIARIPRRGQ
ncbi:MAG: putative DNA binding domain-containing protein [Proteobacteria bacterium]|nr:putative DNA binding domain-containing protein [Pseudomonadota bacterium]